MSRHVVPTITRSICSSVKTQNLVGRITVLDDRWILLESCRKLRSFGIQSFSTRRAFPRPALRPRPREWLGCRATGHLFQPRGHFANRLRLNDVEHAPASCGRPRQRVGEMANRLAQHGVRCWRSGRDTQPLYDLVGLARPAPASSHDGPPNVKRCPTARWSPGPCRAARAIRSAGQLSAASTIPSRGW